MRIGNLKGRLTLFTEGGAIDVEDVSHGAFSADPQAVYDRWEQFRAWAADVDVSTAAPFAREDLGCPTPLPAQTFAVALNYRMHAKETGLDQPQATPLIFTKFSSSLVGPVASVTLPTGSVDWEAELTVVMGRTARNVPASEAWSYVAGVTVGQDLSERELQMAGAMPQFSLAKSFPGFTPIGPWVVSIDELDDPDNLAISCSVNGETVQEDRTDAMIFSVPEVIAFLSSIVQLRPGDIILTGTPAGVGMSRQPPRFLNVGDTLVTTIEGVGQIEQTFV